MPDTITIPTERYEQLLDSNIRVGIVCDFISEHKTIDIVTLLTLLGDYSLAKEIQNEEVV